jgi:hypothetical protein
MPSPPRRLRRTPSPPSRRLSQMRYPIPPPTAAIVPDAVAAKPPATPDAVTPRDATHPTPGQAVLPTVLPAAADMPCTVSANPAVTTEQTVPVPPAPDSNGLTWTPSTVSSDPGDADQLRIKRELLGYGQTDTLRHMAKIVADAVVSPGLMAQDNIHTDAVSRARGRLDAYKFKLCKIGDLGGDAPRCLLAFYNRDEHAAIRDFRRDWPGNNFPPQVSAHNPGKAAHLAMEASAYVEGAANVAMRDADTALCIQLALEDRMALDVAAAGDARAWVRTPGNGGTSVAWGTPPAHRPPADAPPAPASTTSTGSRAPTTPSSAVQERLVHAEPAKPIETAAKCLRTPAQALSDLRGDSHTPVTPAVELRSKRRPSARQAKDSKQDALRTKMMNERTVADNVRQERKEAKALDDKRAKETREMILEEALTRISNAVTLRVLDDIGFPQPPSLLP